MSESTRESSILASQEDTHRGFFDSLWAIFQDPAASPWDGSNSIDSHEFANKEEIQRQLNPPNTREACR